MSNTEDQNIEGTKVHLITWNPELWPDLTDELIDATIKVLHAGSRIIDQWSVGSRRNDIESGDSVFLLRQGNDRRGIVAKGIVLGEIFQGPHWDGSKKEANYVEYLLENHVTVDHRLTIADLETHINPSSGKSAGASLPSHCPAHRQAPWGNPVRGPRGPSRSRHRRR